MDINCIFDCIYQSEGKCTLTDLSALKNISLDENLKACPYMEKPKNKN